MIKKKPTLCIVATTIVALTGVATANAQNFDPVQLTPDSYTQDIIVENTTPSPGGAPTYYGINVTVGNGSGLGDNTYYEQGMVARLGQTGGNSGIPVHNSIFTNINDASMAFLMPPDYTVENDDLMIDSTYTSGTFTFNSSTTATNLAILCTGGGGAVTIDYIVTHDDLSTETGSISVPDWFSGGATVAWGANGRITKDGGYNNYNASGVNNNPPYLYASQITVSAASPVNSITLNYNSGQHANFFAVSGNSSGTWSPIAVTGFNVKAIVPAAFPLTATMDQGTNTAYNGNLATWFELGYADAAGYTESGLPHAGALLTNINNSAHVYKMAPDYTANNAILIDTNHQVANITPASPDGYTAFAILTAGGNIGGGNIMTNQIIMQHANGVSETNLFFAYDWFANNSQIAFTTGGRVNMANRTLNALDYPVTISSNPKLFESTFGLNETVSPVTNIVLRYLSAPGASSTTYVLAVSASAGAVAPVILTQSRFANGFVGGDASAFVQLSAGSEPLTFLWQTNDVTLSDGGKITGSSTANVSFTGLEFGDASTLQVIITNVAGAVTSAPIPLVVMSTNLDVTLPGDPVVGYQASGNPNDWPAGENPTYAIDGTTSKYLNGDIENGAVGFTVTPLQGSSIVTGLRLYAANDAPGRDPATYYLEGSDDGVNWFYIAYDVVNLPDARNSGQLDLSPTNQSLAEVSFANATSYASYRLSFPTVKDASPNLMQIGEVEFLGTLVASSPAIVSDVPANITYNFEGLDSSLTVVASGTQPLSYQWKLNGGVISGATNSTYTFATLLGTNLYSCVVSNSVNPPATSDTATVVGMTVPETFVVNFHYAMAAQYAADTNEADLNMWTNVTYTGLGAYPDEPANTNWNGFGRANGYQPVFDASVSPQRASDGSLTPVTFTATYNLALNNLYFYGDGTPGNTCADCPSLVLNAPAIAQNGQPDGTFTLHNVPPGNYTVYLYGKSWNNDRDTKFTVNSGSPYNGWDTCTNAANTNFATAFVLHENYVYFEGVSPNPDGTITGTFSGKGVTNAVSGLTGEGSLDAVQLIRTPALPLLSITTSGSDLIVSWTPAVGQLQAADQLTGTFTNVVGATSPYTNSATAAESYFRVKVQ